MAFQKVASVQEVPVGKGKQVVLNGQKIALFHAEGGFHAIEDSCCHRGASLWEGELDGTEVICPWHGARFDLTTGAALCPPASRDQLCYPVQLVGDEIHIDVK